MDYLFIDKISMINCNLLLQISEALMEAKGDTSAFRSIEIIFAGDFVWLSLVGQAKLFRHIKVAKAMARIQYLANF